MPGKSVARKLLDSHVVKADNGKRGMKGSEILVRIDQTLTQDTTGTMAYLQFEALGVPRVKTERSVSYVDHNLLQVGFENADDHNFLQDMAAKYGIIFSRPGNGICHQVHLERFGLPGKTLLGSDSHTPTAGALGMLAMGAGGLDVALAMAGFPFSLPDPKVVRVTLTGRLQPMVGAKDIILELLRRLTVKGGVGKIFEYGGEGVSTLSVPQRGTIANMGAELGATTSVFPSDEVTKRFLEAQGRASDWIPLTADPDAAYDEEISVDLSALEPLIALPHMPDKVVPVRQVAGTPVDQCFIGSCTNSSYYDLAVSAAILRGRHVAEKTSLVIGPGSRQTLLMIARAGILSDFVEAGARILECACGPCIGIGQAPRTGGISLRTSNRNFEGRSGTKDALVHLVSAETAAASAIAGVITDPRDLGPVPLPEMPGRFVSDDSLFVFPKATGENATIRRGPNIAALPDFEPLPASIEGEILLRVGDDITTDHILPAGSKIMSLRSNLPAISEYCFAAVDPSFPARARATGGGILVGGENYGQGSSREHAALSPRFLGVRAVIALSYARIHRQNLVNAGILPLVFENAGDYNGLKQGDRLSIVDVFGGLKADRFEVRNVATGKGFFARHGLSDRQVGMLLAGGALNAARRELTGI
ncbi:MAG: aconitate hydratase [Spirochaetes bacterium]|nr:aconitate hydratase [Spirochaetota bacterium]